MRTVKFLAIVLALAGAGCAGFAGVQNAGGDSASGADGEGAGTVLNDDASVFPEPSRPGDSGQPAPAAGLVGARVQNTTDRSAEVTIRFLLNGVLVHFARLQVGPHVTSAMIGPDVAQIIEFAGTDENGTPLPPATFVFGVDVDEDNPAIYVISDSQEEEPQRPVDGDDGQTDEPDEETPEDSDEDDSEADEPEEEEEGAEPDEPDQPPPGGGGGGPPPLTDCNGNSIDDADDIAGGASSDCNSNAVPDECDPAGDFDADGHVDPDDFSSFVGCLTGPCTNPPCAAPRYGDPCCILADFDQDNDVDVTDFGEFQQAFTNP